MRGFKKGPQWKCSERQNTQKHSHRLLDQELQLLHPNPNPNPNTHEDVSESV